VSRRRDTSSRRGSGRAVRIALRWAAVLAGIGLASLALLLVYGVALVDNAIAVSARSPSARLLSAPLTIRSGEPWDPGVLRVSLERRGLTATRLEAPRAGEFLALGGGGFLVARGGRDGGATSVRPAVAGVTVAAENGTAAEELTIRPMTVGATAPNDVVRWPVPLAGVSSHLITAVVDIEDRTFLQHSGLSLRGMVRAAVQDLLAGGVRQGGSTITQQLAKILMLRPARTVPRKVLEAWLATLLEYRFDKRRILEVYLNRIYLGQDGGLQLQGVEAASRFYFGKRADELALEEAALIAGMIAAPNRFDPFTHPVAARARRNLVVTAMVRARHVDAGLAERLREAPLPSAPHRLRWPPSAHYAEAVPGLVARQGDVACFLEPDLQAAVHGGVVEAVRALEQRHATLRRLREDGDPLQAAVVALAPDGRVLAVQGSRDGLPGEFNRAVQAKRQVGSLVKPFVVAAALEEGWSLEATLDDSPLVVPLGAGVWSPENSDGRYRGLVTVRDALVHSLNVPTVRLGLDVSVPRVLAGLRRVGWSPPEDRPSVLLGAFEATPLEVARAYAALVARGRMPSPAWTPAEVAAARPAIDADAAAVVVSALRGVVTRGTAASLAGRVDGEIAAKTGTTDRRRDSWFVALRPRLITVVWVGTDGNRETGLYGATGALEVWRAIDARTPAVWRSGSLDAQR
jgi:penicillin-binding protein 1B